jgi:ribonuclease-3
LGCQKDGLTSNERLEFLGDSVLDMIVVDMLFRKFPDGDEGEMTRMKARLVSRESLNLLGQEIGVEHLLDAQTGKGSVHASLRGNAMEAVVGAVYLDRGFRKTQRGVLKLLKRFDLDHRLQATVDFKSKLHEWGQKRKKKIQFKVVREFKRDGQQLYKMQVLIGGKVMGTSDGPSKKSAEQAAAREACRHIFGDD